MLVLHLEHSVAAMFNSFHLMAHKLIIKILQPTNNVFFADLTKNRYNFDSFTPDGCCCVGCCYFFLFDKLRENSSVPRTE